MTDYQGYRSPPPTVTPPLKTKHIPFADIVNETWGRQFEVDQNGTRVGGLRDGEAAQGGVLLTVKLVRETNALLRAILSELRGARQDRQRPGASPAAKPTAAALKAERERQSRERATAAYLRAGGDPSALDDDAGGHADAPPMRVPADVPPVAEWRMSARARKAMFRLNITTAAELVAKTADELMEARNFGETTLREVRNRLRQFGLALRGEKPPDGAPG